MRISLAELNNIVCELENSGHYKEAQDLHQVFVKVADLEKEAGLKEIGKAAIPALALMGNMGSAVENKPIDNPVNVEQKMVQPMKLQQPTNEEDPIEKDLEIINQEEQKFSGNVSDRLKQFLSKFEWSEISKILEKKGIEKKITSEQDLEDPQILDVLENYYKEMNLEKLNPIFDPIAQEISRLLMNNKTNEQRLVKLVKQYWGLQNRSTRFDSVFMRELNLKLKQVANTDRTQLRKFLLILRMNFQTKPKPGKPSMFPGV
jgi:hypothetical protein